MIQPVFRTSQGQGFPKLGGAQKFLKFFLCAAILAASQRTGSAQVQTINCGGLNDHACGFFETEFWANNSGFCDRGLKPSNGNFKALMGDGGVCVNDNRQTVPNGGGWIGWAMNEQRMGIQKDLPINLMMSLGTHNSYSNYADGDNNPISTDQYYSITDQLNLGARVLRIDPWFYYGQLRTCHASAVDECIAEALIPTYGAGAVLVELAPAVQLAPPPIPVLADVAIGLEAGLGSVAINSRLFASTIREISEWLEANPKEVVTIYMNDNSGGNENLVNAALQAYFGARLYTPSDFIGTDGAVPSLWPTLDQLQALNKQVIVINNGGNSSLTFPNSQFTTASVATPQTLTQCSTLGLQNLGKWSNLGEDRSLSGISSPAWYVTAPLIQQAQLCGVSTVLLDFFESLGSQQISQPVTDGRRQASIWSYAENDFGTAGPAVMNIATGRWTSTSPTTVLHPACSQFTSKYLPHTWQIGPLTNYYNAESACNTFGSDWHFGGPAQPWDNIALQRTATGYSSVLLNYSAVTIPLATVTPALTDAYMDRGGAAPDPIALTVDGFTNVSITPTLTSNVLNLVSLTPLSTETLNAGSAQVTLSYNPATTAAAPDGTYLASVDVASQTSDGSLAAYGKSSFSTLYTHVMEETTTRFSVDPPTQGTGYPAGSPVTLRAQVSAPCGEPTDPVSQGSIGITGGVTFTDSIIPPGGVLPETTTTLGIIPINNSADSAGANSNGALTAILCPNDNAVCASTVLPPGIHLLTATYNRDSTYNSSQALPVQITVGVPANSQAPAAGPISVSQSSLLFTSQNQSPPASQTVNVSYNGSPLTAVSSAPWLTASITADTPGIAQVTVTASPGGLANGVFSGLLTILGPGQTSATAPAGQSVSVTLTNSNSGPETTINTSPSGLQIDVDGTNYTSPWTFLWQAGSSHQLSQPSGFQTITTGERAAFRIWSDGNSSGARTLQAGAGSNSLVAEFDVQYELTGIVSPACSGITNPVQAWFDSGTVATLSQTPNSGYFFSSFAGAVTGKKGGAQSLVMNAPKVVVVYYDCNGSSCPAGDSLQTTPNAVVVSATQSQPVQITTAFGVAVPFSFTSSQPWLTMTADSTQTPATLTLSVNPSKVTTTTNASVTIHSTSTGYADIAIPVSIAPIPVTFTTANSETIVVDDGAPVATPVTFNWPLNSLHKAMAQTQSPAAGVQDRFQGWSAPGATIEFLVTAPIVYNAKFQQFAQVAFVAVPSQGGTFSANVPSPDGYYAVGVPLTVTATANPGFVFEAFANLAPGNPVTLTPAASPLQVQAKFVQAESYSISTSLGANGSETIDGVTTHGPATAQWAINTSHTVSVPALVALSPGTQYVFSQWSDGIKTASRTINSTSSVSLVAEYQQQFLVTITAAPTAGGSVSGGGWYNANAPASLTAAPAGGFSFTGFTGTVAGSQSPLAITVSQPENALASFAPASPALSATAGAHTNTNANEVQLTIVFTDNGAATAGSVTVNSIAGMAQSGSGAISALSALPLPFTLLPGQSQALSFTIAWPSTAVRVGFTVNFAANNGAYTGTSTFYVLR
jgi:hypothetical protein